MKLMINRKVVAHRLAGSRFFKYVLVGFGSYILVTTVTFVVHELIGASERVSFIAGIGLALFLNVYLLKIFVFSSKRGFLDTGSKFILTSLLFRGFEFLIYSFLLQAQVYYLVASTVAMFIGAFTKFFVLKFVVYNR